MPILSGKFPGSEGRSRAAFLNQRVNNPRRRPGETKTAARQRLIAKASRKGIGGRPTLYSPELADQILTHITIGDTVKEAAERFKINPDTVWEWMHRYPDFREGYERAREARGNAWAEQIIHISDDLKDEAKSRDVRIKSRQWVIARTSQTFADKPQVEITQNILQMTPEARDRLALELIADLKMLAAEGRRRAEGAKLIEAEPVASEPETT